MSASTRRTAAADDHFGLRAAESLVREHGGTLEVESAPGLGHDRPGGGPARMIRVVLADDHAVVRRGLAGLIESTDDLEVVGVAQGRQRGGRAGPRAPARRGGDGPPDARARRRRGHPRDRGRADGHRGAGADLVLRPRPDRRRHRGGAVGYLLKDAEPEALLDGIRAVARGESPARPAGRPPAAVARPHARASGGRPRRTSGLSPREAEVLRLVVEGLLNKQIASRLGITERTVKAHLTSAYQRIGVADRTQAALWAQRHDLDGVRPAQPSPAIR